MCVFLSSTSIIQNVHNSCADFSSSSCRRWISSLRVTETQEELAVRRQKTRKVLPDALSSLPLLLSKLVWDFQSSNSVSDKQGPLIHTVHIFQKKEAAWLSPYYGFSGHFKLCFLCPLCFLFLSLVCLPGMGWTVMQLLSDLFCNFGRPSENSHNMAGGLLKLSMVVSCRSFSRAQSQGLHLR